MNRHATISKCGLFRYWLERSWTEPMTKGFVNFVLLNPSTADGTIDDATVRKCIGFAKRWGYDGMHIVNLFAYRSTDSAMLRHTRDPVGPETDAMIEAGALSASVSIVGWGGWSKHPSMKDRASRVMAIMQSVRGHTVKALQINADGSPKHPLYVGYGVTPVPYQVAIAVEGGG